MSRYHTAHLLIEAAGKRRIRDLAAKHGLPEDEIRVMAEFDPTDTDKFLGWIAAQVAAGELSIPADGPEVKTLLEGFGRKGKLTGEPDIDRWTFGALKERLGVTESKGEVERSKVEEGQRVFYENAPWKVIEITTPEAASKLLRDPNDPKGERWWCIKDPKFWDQYGCGEANPAYLVLKDGNEYACMVPHRGELKDIYDQPLRSIAEFFPLLERLERGIRIKWIGDFEIFKLLRMPFEEMASDPYSAYEYASKILDGQFPEGEPAIASDSWVAFVYARDVIDGPFPEGEPAIASDPHHAYLYVRYIIKRPWPEGEAMIATSPSWSYQYAIDGIPGRFLEGEPAIASDAKMSVRYAEDVIKGPFPEGEAAIAGSGKPRYIRDYGDLIGDPSWADKYTKAAAATRTSKTDTHAHHMDL